MNLEGIIYRYLNWYWNLFKITDSKKKLIINCSRINSSKKLIFLPWRSCICKIQNKKFGNSKRILKIAVPWRIYLGIVYKIDYKLIFFLVFMYFFSYNIYLKRFLLKILTSCILKWVHKVRLPLAAKTKNNLK